MNKLLEIKDKAVKFCGEYEHFILPVVRFAVAFIAFITKIAITINISLLSRSCPIVTLSFVVLCPFLSTTSASADAFCLIPSKK